MKKLIFIVMCSLVAFSCQKEQKPKEKEILIETVDVYKVTVNVDESVLNDTLNLRFIVNDSYRNFEEVSKGEYVYESTKEVKSIGVKIRDVKVKNQYWSISEDKYNFKAEKIGTKEIEKRTRRVPGTPITKCD